MKPKGFLLSAAIDLAIAFFVAALRGGYASESAAAGFGAWSDAFFAAGVFVGGAGLLAFAASDGLFDIIRYGLGKVLRLALGKERREAYPKTFFDYRLAKQGRGVAGLSAVAAGLLSVGVAGLFLVLS